MAIEDGFQITQEQITEAGIRLRQETPEYVWGEGELRNAIFEHFIDMYELPWNEMGFPEWTDTRVRGLYEVFQRFFTEEERDLIYDVIAKCETEACEWSTVGQAIVNRVSRILSECDLTTKCRGHHLGIGDTNHHNRFVLYHRNSQVGTASVSSQVCTGYIE